MNNNTNASSTTPLVGGATTHQGSTSPWANGRHGLKGITYFSSPSRSSHRSNKDDQNNTNVVPPAICRASPKSPMNFIAKKHTVEQGGTGFTRPVAVCFALNYVVGTGFLVLPYVFVQAGIVLSIITVVLSSVASDMAKDYVLVSMARAEYYLEQQQGRNNNKSGGGDLEKANNGGGCPCKPNDCSRLTQSERDSLLDLLVSKKPKIIDRYQSLGEDNNKDDVDDSQHHRRVILIPPLKEGSYYQNGNINNNNQNNHNGNGNNGNNGNGKLIVKDRTIELSSLSDIFLGKPGLIIYTFFLSIYMYMMLWAYTSVFAQAMATSLPLPLTYMPNLDNYTFYAIIFGLIVCPISLMEVEDQVVMQITLTILRVLRLLIMILSAAFCPHCFQGNDDDLLEEAEPIPLWRFQGIYILLPVVIAANLMHEALPDLSHPVQDKRTLGQTFQWTFICTGIIYSILGAAVGYCFGSSVEPSANINWEAFHSPTGNNDWIYRATGYFVVISPALDVISAYPLNAIALGNNLMEVPWCSCFGGGGDSTESNETNESSVLKEPSYAIRMMFRMISAIPPMIGALFVRDLGIITDYAGTAGLAVTFCITSAFFIASANYVDSSKKTYYDSYATTHTLAWSLLVFGVGIVVFVLYQLATEDERN